LRNCAVYWFRSFVEMYIDSMLRSTSGTLSKVLKADLGIHSHAPTNLDCRSSMLFKRCNSFVQAVRQGTPIIIRELTDGLRHRLWTV